MQSQPAQRAFQGLQVLVLEITGKCNLSCSHCYAESGPRLSLRGEMSREDWLRVIDEAAALGCRRATFLGGEPTLHPDLPAMIERLTGHGFNFIEVFTNATHLKPALLDCFRRHRVYLGVSFYSAEATVHEAITGVAGSWRKTVDGLKAALAAQLPIRVAVTEMAANRGQSEHTVEFLQRLGLSLIRVDRMREVGRAETLAGAAEAEGERFSELCGQCWRGMCVTSSGETYPCPFSRRTRVGNAKMGLEGILANPQLQAFRETLLWGSGDKACHPVKYSDDTGQPLDNPDEACHPVLHPDEDSPLRRPADFCQPVLHPDEDSPVRRPDDFCHPVKHPDKACHPVHHPDDFCHPVKHPDDFCHPVKHPDEACHPVRDPDDFCHPVLHPDGAVSAKNPGPGLLSGR